MSTGKRGNWSRGARATRPAPDASDRMRRIVVASVAAAPQGSSVSVIVLGSSSEEDGDCAAGLCVGAEEAALVMSRARQGASGQLFSSFGRYFKEDTEVERSSSAWHGRVVSRSGAKVVSGRYNLIVSTVTRRALPPWAQSCTADCDASEWVERYEARYKGASLIVEVRRPLGEDGGAVSHGVEMEFPSDVGADAVHKVLGWVYPN